MAIVLRRSYSKAKLNMIKCVPGGTTICPLYNLCISRKIGDEKNNADFIDSTILIENGFHVTELPVVVRRLRDLSDIEDKPLDPNRVSIQENSKAPNYHLIQAEFNECVDLRDVFSLLSKCTKITPNIALGAVERIYDLEKNPLHMPMHIPDTNVFHVNIAKGAILDKLLKVIMKTEETRTILNVLNTVSTFMQPHKQKFCDELLIRVVENKLSVEQLCDFMGFLIQNKDDSRYSDMIDKLWIGFIDKEMDINETNIGNIFAILPSLKTSKRTITTLLEQKLVDVWFKLDPKVMQEILDVFVEEKYLSLQSFSVVGRWLYTNIHALNEESLLDIITKLTRLNYTDNHIEKAVEKYMKLKSSKIESHILLVGVLNYCMQFQIYNEAILNACSDYIVRSSEAISPSFLKSLVYPYGHLCFDPKNSTKFWPLIENMLNSMFCKLTTSDLCSIILSFIYNGKYPVKFVSKIFCAEYLAKVTNPQTMGALHLIDTSLSLECKDYLGPLLPKDQWSNPVLQDARIKNIIEKIHSSLLNVAGGEDKMSLAVSIPNMLSHETYLIDIMLHPVGLGSNTFNWKLKSNRNENVAVLIHLPDHYCSDNVHLIGSQEMKKRHLKILGMKVVGLKYSLLSQFYTSRNTQGLRKYLEETISKAETSE